MVRFAHSSNNRQAGDKFLGFRNSKPSSSGWTLPELPQEIIHEIMLAVTDIYPSPYSSHCQSPITTGTMVPFLLNPNPDLEVNLHRRSLATKSALSRVCKLWRVHSAELLFNTIVLHNLQQIDRIFYAFQADRARRGGVEGPGSWASFVRRLWVAETSKFDWFVTPKSANSQFGVHDLLRRCSNIISFRNFGHLAVERPMYCSSNDATGVACAIMQIASGDQEDKYGKKLPQELMEVGLDLSATNWKDITCSPTSGQITTFPRIGALKTVRMPFYSASPEGLLPGLRFPSLTYLELSGFRCFLQATMFTMPALKSLTFDPSAIWVFSFNNTDSRLSGVIKFFEVHGAKLEELNITSSLYQELELERLCPNLITLNVAALSGFGNNIYLNCTGVRHSNVQRVGFGGLDMGEWVEREDPFNFFESLLRAFPNVQAIQDLSWNPGTVKSGAAFCWSQARPRRRNSFWEGTLQLMQERNIQLIDWHGIPIRV